MLHKAGFLTGQSGQLSWGSGDTKALPLPHVTCRLRSRKLQSVLVQHKDRHKTKYIHLFIYTYTKEMIKLCTFKLCLGPIVNSSNKVMIYMVDIFTLTAEQETLFMFKLNLKIRIILTDSAYMVHTLK